MWFFMTVKQNFVDISHQAVKPAPNERASDQFVLKEYLEAVNPVTRSVLFDILVRRLESQASKEVFCDWENV